MTNRIINQHGAKTIGLGVVVGRFSLDCQHENVGFSSSRCSNDSSFRYTKDEQIDISNQRPLLKNGLGKMTNYNYTVIFRETQQKVVIVKE